MPVVGKEETEYIEYPHSGNSPKKYWIEYWSAFNKYQINDFVYILDEARGKAESKRAWVPGAIFATSIFISIASVALNPLAGLVVGVTSTIVGSAIQYYVDSYPNDLDKVSVAIRQVVYKYPNKTLVKTGDGSLS